MPKTVFVAGDEVNGTIILTCDKKTDCKSFRVVIQGVLTARGKGFESRGKGRTVTKTYTQSIVIHQEEIIFAQETAFDPGIQKFEFQFKIPADAKNSYVGYGNIRYAILAHMDVSKKIKIKEIKPIKIFQLVDEVAKKIAKDVGVDKVTKEVAEHEGANILEVEIDSKIYYIGNKISFRCRVNTDMKFKSLRARIEHIENEALEGKIPMHHSKVLWEEQIPSDEVNRYEWNKWTFNINKALPPWFKYDNLESGIRLKVTIVRSFRLDKTVEIYLLSGHSPESIESLEREVEVVDIEVPKERSRPTRVKCHTCSYSFKLKDDDVEFGTCPSCGKPIYF
jgi:hypothetical protein